MTSYTEHLYTYTYFVLIIVHDLLMQQNAQNWLYHILETIFFFYVLFLGLSDSSVIHITHIVPRAITSRAL